MATNDLYLSTKASILNWINKMTADQIYDFDAVPEEEELEQIDLIGPIEFYMDFAETLSTVGFKIAACTHSDPQIQRLNNMVNSIINNMMGKSVRIPILHHTTGTPLGFMTSNGSFHTSPVFRIKSRTRPFQTVSVIMKLTLTL